MEDGTIWLSRVNIAQLYGTSPQNITMHIKNIYDEGELEEISTSKNYLLVQNKLLYAVAGQTAAELISERVDSSRDNMGLTAFKGAFVRKGDIIVSKNYLHEDEITDLSRIVLMFLDHAEDMARGKTPMTMKDWNNSLNEFLQFRRRKILEGKGKVSRDQMEHKVMKEYAIYNTRRLNTPLDDGMIDGLPQI